MKTTTILSKTRMMLTGIVLLNCLMTSCMTGKTFSDKMKYTYYKKVKADSKKESAGNTASVSTEEKETVLSKKDTATINSRVLSRHIDLGCADNAIAKDKSSSVAASKKEDKSAQAPAPETKNNKVKKIFNEKVKRFVTPKSNLKAANGTRQNVLVTILLVLLIIILLYVVIVLLFFALFNALGGFYLGEL